MYVDGAGAAWTEAISSNPCSRGRYRAFSRNDGEELPARVSGPCIRERAFRHVHHGPFHRSIYHGIHCDAAFGRGVSKIEGPAKGETRGAQVFWTYDTWHVCRNFPGRERGAGAFLHETKGISVKYLGSAGHSALERRFYGTCGDRETCDGG